jgi:hypothetical protein
MLVIDLWTCAHKLNYVIRSAAVFTAHEKIRRQDTRKETRLDLKMDKKYMKSALKNSLSTAVKKSLSSPDVLCGKDRAGIK